VWKVKLNLNAEKFRRSELLEKYYDLKLGSGCNSDKDLSKNER